MVNEYAANTLVNAKNIAEAAALPVGLGMEPLDFVTQTIQLRQPDATACQPHGIAVNEAAEVIETR